MIQTELIIIIRISYDFRTSNFKPIIHVASCSFLDFNEFIYLNATMMFEDNDHKVCCRRRKTCGVVMFVIGFVVFMTILEPTNCWLKNHTSLSSRPKLNVGLLVPKREFRVYPRFISIGINTLSSRRGRAQFNFLKRYEFTYSEVRLAQLINTPSPIGECP